MVMTLPIGNSFENKHSTLWHGVLFFVILATGMAQAWVGMPTPPLHVDGNQLKDPAGNSVNIHGWMQPTSSWFNGQGKWYGDPSDWTDPENIKPMLDYLKDAATVMTDTTPKYGRDHGWYTSFVRMNTDAIGGWDAERGLYDTTQFNGWLDHFIIPYANFLKTRGLYFVLSATGPINTPNNGSRNAGVVEQQRLISFWSKVAGYPGVKDADNIMFELMNEPVEIESEPGNGDWGMGSAEYFEAFTNWLQPVIDTVAATGAKNVVWVPTLEWQGSPHQWAEFPFTGSNIGVAVHFYPAYGDVRDDEQKLQQLWDNSYKLAADQWPMIITELFWTPYPNDYWNLVNGSTDGFGNNIKQAMDEQGNVSYIVGFLSDLLDEQEAMPTESSLLEDREGAPAYFSWQPEYGRELQISFGYREVPGRVQFEQFESMHDIQVESNQGSLAERHVGYIRNGSWTSYKIDVTESGSYTLQFRLASAENTVNQIIVKNQLNTPLDTLTLDVDQTDGWHDWYIDSLDLELESGESELTFEFVGQSAYLFNLDWFEISPAATPTPVQVDYRYAGGTSQMDLLKVSPDQNVFLARIPGQETAKIQVFDSQGRMVFAQNVSGQSAIELEGDKKLQPGVYRIVLQYKSQRISQTLVAY